MLKTLQQASLANLNKPASPAIFRWLKAIKGLTVSLGTISLIASMPYLASCILIAGALATFVLDILPNNPDQV